MNGTSQRLNGRSHRVKPLKWAEAQDLGFAAF